MNTLPNSQRPEGKTDPWYNWMTGCTCPPPGTSTTEDARREAMREYEITGRSEGKSLAKMARRRVIQRIARRKRQKST